MKVTVPFEVLWGDADPSGWIYFAAVLRYVAQAEAKLFRQVGMQTYQMMEHGFANPRVHLEIDYKKPFKVHDQGRCHAWISHVGTSSITMSFQLTDLQDRDVFIEGKLITVTVDIQKEISIPIPEFLRKKLLQIKDVSS